METMNPATITTPFVSDNEDTLLNGVSFGDENPLMGPNQGNNSLSGVSFGEEPSVETTPSPQNLPSNITEGRAQRAHYGLGENSPGVDTLRSMISMGEEGRAREMSAAQVALKDQEAKARIFGELIKNTKGSPVGSEMDLINGLLSNETFRKNPSLIFETEIGKRYMNDVVLARGGQDSINKGLKESPDKTLDTLDAGTEITTKLQIARSIAEEFDTRWKYMSVGEKVWDFVEGVIPFKSWHNFSSSVKEKSIDLLGTTIENAVINLWLLPPDQFQKNLREIVDKLGASNVTDAKDFIEAVFSFSSSDALFKNIMSGFDLLDAAGVAKLGAKGVGKLLGRKAGEAATEETVQRVVRQAAEASGKTPEIALEVMGDVDKARIAKAIGNVTIEAGGREAVSTAEKARHVLNVIPSIMRPGHITSEIGSLTTRAAADLAAALEKNSDRLLGILGDKGLINVSRLTPEAEAIAEDIAKASLRKEHTGINASVMDIVRNEKDVRTNTHSVSMLLGDFDAKPFTTAADAQKQAELFYNLNPNQFSIKGEGKNYAIEIRRSFDETHPSVRQALITSTNSTPSSTFGLTDILFAKLRSPAETTSELAKGNKHVASFQYGKVLELVEDLAKDIGALSKKELDNLSTMLRLNRDFIDPITGDRGRFFSTVGDFEQEYAKAFKRHPTAKETKAYFTAVQINDFDWSLRNAALYRDKSRLGIKNFTVDHAPQKGSAVFHEGSEFSGKSGQRQFSESGDFAGKKPATFNEGDEYASGTSKRTFNEGDEFALPPAPKVFGETDEFAGSPSRLSFNEGADFAGDAPRVPDRKRLTFEGIEADHIPWNTDHLSIAIQDSKSGAVQVITRNASKEQREFVNKKIKEEGYKVVRVASPLSRPLKDLTGSNQPIEFFVVKDFTKSELDGVQLPYRAGGHVDPASKFWLKQEQVYTGADGVKFLEGDRTLFGMSTQAQAQKWAKRMDEANRLFREAKLAKPEATDFKALEDYLEKNLPFSLEHYLKQIESGLINPNQKIRITTSGRRIADDVDMKLEHGENIKDLTKGDYNVLQDADLKYTGERNQNAKTILGEGRGTLADVDLVDPLETMMAGINQAAKSRFFNDLKIASAEQFIQEFHHVMKTPLEELQKYPMWYLHHPDWDIGTKFQPDLARAQAFHNSTLTFVGEKSPLQHQVDWFKNKVMDTIYEAGGDKWLGVANRVADSSLPFLKNPIQFFTNAAFHLKLGLGNTTQLFVQAQGLAHMVAIAPQHAAQAMTGYSLQRFARLNGNPEILNSLADKAAKLGWRREDFIESTELLRRSGWDHIGREQAMMDNITDPKIMGKVGVAGSKALDWSSLFFREAEEMVRMSSWNAAYLEFKKANPRAVIGDREIGQILSRADTMSANMTRASKTQMEQGIFKIPTQFYSYNARLTDQIWGRQLSTGEKARVLGLYSILYGLPSAGSVALAYPLYEGIRQKALESNINVSDKFVNSLIEGIPSTLFTAYTGKEYNAAQRFGPGGLNFLREFANGEKTITELLLGASGGLIRDTLKGSIPVAVGLTEVFQTGGSFEPLMEDLIDVSRNISSVNNTLRMVMALNTGKYTSKNGTVLTKVDSADAIMSGIVGIAPRELSDAFIMNRSMKEQTQLQKEAEKEFVKYYRRGMEEAAKGNTEATALYMKRARSAVILGGFRPDQQTDLVVKALKGYETTVESIHLRWFQDAPQGEGMKRYESLFGRKQQQQGN